MMVVPRTILALAIVLFGGSFLGGCQSKVSQEAQGPALKLTVALRAAPDSGLIAIADEKGYFKAAGVEVSIKSYPAGLLALEAMCRGEADLATVADIALATKMFSEKSIRVVASIGFSTASQIVARKDRDIQTPSNLKGKRVGFTPDTTSDYFLHTFLLTEKIPPKEISAIPIPADKQAQALINGEVDAVSAFDVFAFQATKGLGENAIAWDCQNNLGYQWVLATNEGVLQSPEAVKRFLRALIEAENFATANEADAKAIVVRKLNLDPEMARQGWSKIRLNVSLSQSVVTSLRDFLHWKMTSEGKDGNPPEVLQYIYTGALDDVSPRSVTIFR